MAAANPVIKIRVLSLSLDKSIEKYLLAMIKTRVTHPEFYQLKYHDLNTFTPPSDWDAVILVHPTSEGRLSLTDVTDARYNRLLHNLHEKYGSKCICIIAFNVQGVQEHTQDMRLKLLSSFQPTAFQLSSKIIICSELSEMLQRDIDSLKQFLKNIWLEKTGGCWDDAWLSSVNLTQDYSSDSGNQRKDKRSEETCDGEKDTVSEAFSVRRDEKLASKDITSSQNEAIAEDDKDTTMNKTIQAPHLAPEEDAVKKWQKFQEEHIASRQNMDVSASQGASKTKKTQGQRDYCHSSLIS